MMWPFIIMVLSIYVACFRHTFRMMDRGARKRIVYVPPPKDSWYGYGKNKTVYDGKVTWTKFFGCLIVALTCCWVATPWVLGEKAFSALSTNTGPDRLARAIAGESRKDKIERLESEAKDREDRIKSLEQEVGV